MMRTDKRSSSISFRILLAAVSLFSFSVVRNTYAGPSKGKLPEIYDNTADGEKQIADALAKAKLNHTRVLLQFGANWCVWCHRLHDVFEKDASLKKIMSNEFELVLIDIDDVNGEMHNKGIVTRMGKPTKHGLPVLVVLNEKGNPLTTINTEPMESGDSYDVSKVHATLSKWKLKQKPAQAVMTEAMSQAKEEGKNIFVNFSAPWCSECHKMASYLTSETSGAAMRKAFVPVKIDIERMAGGEAYAEELGRTAEDGLPFFAVLDAAGNKLADSRAPTGNVGFPAESFEIEHFIKVLKTHGKGLGAAELKALENGFKSSEP